MNALVSGTTQLVFSFSLKSINKFKKKNLKIIALATRGLSWFHTNFKIISSIAIKCSWNCDRNCTVSVDSFGQYRLLTTLIIPVRKCEISFLLFVSSSIDFINILQFSIYRSFISSVKFISRQFIPLDPIINGTVFLISDSLLLVYGNRTNICVLILYC